MGFLMNDRTSLKGDLVDACWTAWSIQDERQVRVLTL